MKRLSRKQSRIQNRAHSNGRGFYKGCKNKVRYPSRRVAFGSIATTPTDRPELLEAYRCDFCRGWHIGHRHSKLKVGA